MIPESLLPVGDEVGKVESPRLRRTMDATALNIVANHPEVRPWLGGEGVLDLSGLLSNPQNVGFVSEHGGFVAHGLDLGLYEAHSLFLPEGRGEESRRAMQEACQYMFTATDCTELVTKVPGDNPAAAGLARMGGFEKRFTRYQGWKTDTGLCDLDFYGLSVARWILKQSVTVNAGVWFHERLTAAKEAAGSSLPVHDEDPVHDAFAGAAVLMCRAGNAVKAVATYNRWAVVAGYQTIALLSLAPIVLDVRDAVIEMREQDLEVLLCR